MDEYDAVLRDAQPVLLRMALLSYGTVGVLRTSRGGEPEFPGPRGAFDTRTECQALHEIYRHALQSAPTAEKAMLLLDEARAELAAWIRRPYARDKGETLEDLCARIISDGWGVPTNECAMAFRCTVTLIRRARLAARRHPETGYHLPAEQPDPMQWARALDKAGLSLRQIETLTGLPRSTVHDRIRQALK